MRSRDTPRRDPFQGGFGFSLRPSLASIGVEPHREFASLTPVLQVPASVAGDLVDSFDGGIGRVVIRGIPLRSEGVPVEPIHADLREWGWQWGTMKLELQEPKTLMAFAHGGKVFALVCRESVGQSEFSAQSR